MKTRVLVLAAGKSKRMKSEIPKVLIPFKGKPLVQHLLDAIVESGVDLQPAIVVGQTGELIKNTLGNTYQYIFQKEQLGTGHAVQSAEPFLEDAEKLIVLYGDHPFLTPHTIQSLDRLHSQNSEPLAMMTTTLENFEDWRYLFRDFGRVKRNAGQEIEAIIETKDATPEEQEIHEVSPSFFSFRTAWLWEHLKKLENNNAQKEYYLTDLVKMAIREGHQIPSLNVNSLESIGVNTPEQLDIVKKLREDYDLVSSRR
jgi:bifunctional UDP-N-acetylglucosamine pyrophosphorylase/glucosamine-1-phosphate N-acetyltransferase